MMRRTAIIIFLTCISGCSSFKPEPVVYKCPQIQLPPDPTPYVVSLKPNSKPNEVVQAWVATAMAYRNWNLAVHDQVALSR